MKTIILCFAVIALAAAQDPFGRAADDFSVSYPGDVYLFRGKDYTGLGERVHVKKDSCINFKEAWNDKVASIDLDIDTCILAYADPFCRGNEVVRLEKRGYGTADLSLIRMMEKISSLRRCE